MAGSRLADNSGLHGKYIVVIVVIVTGGKQSQLLAFALGLGWSLTTTNQF